MPKRLQIYQWMSQSSDFFVLKDGAQVFCAMQNRTTD
jgi:hypothetical protein